MLVNWYISTFARS